MNVADVNSALRHEWPNNNVVGDFSISRKCSEADVYPKIYNFIYIDILYIYFKQQLYDRLENYSTSFILLCTRNWPFQSSIR